jgi:alpha-amylase
MCSVALIFQIHQPYRLRRYSVFETDATYFDDARNGEILRKVADKCYRPATRLMLDLARRHEGAFRFAVSISGTALEQLERWAPDVVEVFRELTRGGWCEVLAETSHHSLASLFSEEELVREVDAHARKIEAVFGRPPRVVRNTELLYSDAIAGMLARVRDGEGEARFVGVLAEGAEEAGGVGGVGMAVARVAKAGGAGVGGGGGGVVLGRGGMPLVALLRHGRLSDDIGFRFSNRAWSEWPLTPVKFAGWVARCGGGGGPVVLCMDYETIGEHQWAETGIFEFFAGLPAAILGARVEGGTGGGERLGFVTPSEAVEAARGGRGEKGEVPVLRVGSVTSWADTEKDASAWQGNAMQRHALAEAASLEGLVASKVARARASGSGAAAMEAERLATDWRRLLTSDHYYYMSTKYFADGAVHQYFTPYDSPYDAYINFMNVVDNLRGRLVEG